jgi:hypothetical protein
LIAPDALRGIARDDLLKVLTTVVTWDLKYHRMNDVSSELATVLAAVLFILFEKLDMGMCSFRELGVAAMVSNRFDHRSNSSPCCLQWMACYLHRAFFRTSVLCRQTP